MNGWGDVSVEQELQQQQPLQEQIEMDVKRQNTGIL